MTAIQSTASPRFKRTRIPKEVDQISPLTPAERFLVSRRAKGSAATLGLLPLLHTSLGRNVLRIMMQRRRMCQKRVSQLGGKMVSALSKPLPSKKLNQRSENGGTDLSPMAADFSSSSRTGGEVSPLIPRVTPLHAVHPPPHMFIGYVE